MSSIITVERTNLVLKTFYVNEQSDKNTAMMEKMINDFIKKNKITELNDPKITITNTGEMDSFSEKLIGYITYYNIKIHKEKAPKPLKAIDDHSKKADKKKKSG